MKYNILFAVIITASCFSASAAINSVYIDQIGNSNNIEILQIGTDNTVKGFGGSDSNAVSKGNNNVMLIEQIGNNNTLQYEANGSANQVRSRITGNGNTSKIRLGTPTTPVTAVILNETVIGNGNTTEQNIGASNVTSTIKIDGSNNNVSTVLNSVRGNSYVELMPNSVNNTVEIEQLDSAGINGHVASVVLLGTSNAILIQQQGTVDTVTRLNVTGDSNTITVRSSSSTIIDSRTAQSR